MIKSMELVGVLANVAVLVAWSALIGLIGGAIVGLVAGVVYCGFIALFINMSNNLQLLADERR